ncbi:hypothetical protein DPX16_8973 [Anabarilius grahami]|uniref:Uncharacterized protein n=1 Tax=Anabarilius grahami TaxID=495550 RepID=A0A3N0XCT9_ANAGA|nr:hypothetical protein DPX16_8973 [Anabarilius grahami]
MSAEASDCFAEWKYYNYFTYLTQKLVERKVHGGVEEPRESQEQDEPDVGLETNHDEAPGWSRRWEEPWWCRIGGRQHPGDDQGGAEETREGGATVEPKCRWAEVEQVEQYRGWR